MKKEDVPVKRIEWSQNCIRIDLGPHPEDEADMRVVLTSWEERSGTKAHLYNYKGVTGEKEMSRMCCFTYTEKYEELAVDEILEIAKDSYKFIEEKCDGRGIDPDQ